MHARILPAALQQDVVAIAIPGLAKRRVNDRAAVTLAAMLRVGDDVFQEPVGAAAAQKIGRRDQHARRRDTGACIRDEDGEAIAGERFRPDAFAMVS